MTPHVYDQNGECLNCKEKKMNEVPHESPQTPEEIQQWKRDQEAEGAAPYSSLHPQVGSSHDSESQYTMMQRLAAQQEVEDLPPDPKGNPVTLQEAAEGLNQIAEAINRTIVPQATFDNTIERQQKLKTERKRRFNYEDKSPGFEARLKNIEDKPPMSLLSPIFLDGISRVLGHGSNKYGPNMWREDPMPHTAEIDSILRHLKDFNFGEDVDSDSQELHLFNAACRLMFLAERYYTRPDLDDRYKPFGQIGPTDFYRYEHLRGE